MLAALPDDETIGIDTSVNHAVGAHRQDTELKFEPGIAEVTQAACVPALGKAHGSFAAGEHVAIAKFGSRGERTGGHERLFTVYAVVIPSPGFFPASGDCGLVAAWGIAVV